MADCIKAVNTQRYLDFLNVLLDDIGEELERIANVGADKGSNFTDGRWYARCAVITVDTHVLLRSEAFLDRSRATELSWPRVRTANVYRNF